MVQRETVKGFQQKYINLNPNIDLRFKESAVMPDN